MAHESTVSQVYNHWQLTASELSELSDAYEGELSTENLGMSLPPELRRLHTIVNWNRLVVDTIEERLDVIGFRQPGASDMDDTMHEWWKANNLDEESSFGHLDALIYGRAYLCVGMRDPSEDQSIPLLTVESPKTMYVDTDPRTRRERYGVRFYGEDPDRRMWTSATLYLPDGTYHYHRADDGRWVEDQNVRNEHGIGRPLVKPLLNRARIGDKLGRSEMADIRPLTNAACRALTNLQGAQELMAVPQRYILGVTEQDFKNPDGTRKTPLEAYMSRIWGISNPDASAGQFPAASLENFATAININAKLASSLSGVPLRFFGVVSDVNPTSPESVRADESRLVKRAERKQKLFGVPWQEIMKLGMRVVGWPDSEIPTRLETQWRDASTPTWAASAQAAVQLYQAGIIPKESAWTDLGYTPEQQARMAAQMGDDPLNRLLRTVGADDGADVDAVPSGTGSDLSQNSVGGGIAAAQSRE